ncbi:methylated-DNA--[protein]-cysteine S-methyltransferase [Chitinophaga sp. Mgbs1]|uniref:Methylated-DNA--protein-cysteine methyltransferase n=1 Tax=Chitinophaga solisilvae TaxID=1233460 RepID=A0A3S1DLG5_9BACT|nr:methylated-DNA--[protein]-cysteine S-methyltransferase [Chitinophaga solisilvae]
MAEKIIYTTEISTPLGEMIAGVTTAGLCLLEFTDRIRLQTQKDQLEKKLQAVLQPGYNAYSAQIEEELAAYFSGRRQTFSIPLVVPGTTFEQSVWQQLQKIPYGETCSYKDLALILKNEKAVRAVGTANGRNRIAIIIPCHRVIGANGSLTGYAGGMERKQRLLNLERDCGF